ncbi:MAG: serine acetyltransferase [Phycisphaerales bacterium]|nr:serine acetyltransferase [Phycisphaerales bacterium]
MSSRANQPPATLRAIQYASRALRRGAPCEARTRRRLPSQSAIAWAAHQLHHVMLSNKVEMEEVVELLHPEMVCAFMSASTSQRIGTARANRSMCALLRALPKIQRVLLVDLEGAFERDPAARSRAEIVLCYPGIRALCVHRVAHELHRLRVPLVDRMLSESAHDSTGIDIHPGATIGSGFFIDHGTSVVIGETAVIGRNCTLYQGVTLGARRFDRHADGSIRRGSKRHPTLRDNVTVYANATILGGDTIIGRGSTIAAGVLVQESVPANSIVKPARVELTVARRGRGRAH